ncbi:hypothetical protein PR003_g9225 [Phytophthora rubi]|uniref:Protein kinase domain-containing protein n=1 Tax=Phytophthora rubi TaxID=129364 RepID=A0A6A3NAH5_9STRA|nr:hypothetical protein PR002_g9058 [Phytophthora rubi]KAE9041279.1 hypothetical protein PR001_g6693 [Phytophthora rubi]KAE9342929.1 hypothetical protein PR003_g9225 [Phytophthora rubi]
MMDDVTGFEQAAKKSWQSFSTMRRFVDEATRLENASWRLWFMQRSRAPHGADEPDAEDAGAPAEGPRALCVYCELHSASLSCNGCCHDCYCVSCFKLIHKKGNLALHTAVKIHVQHHRHSEREAASSSGASTTCEEADLSTTSKSSFKKSSDGDHEASSAGPSSPQQKPAGSIFNKPWELQMDMLLQRLMMNSIHSELDISVHNIDARDSLDASDSIDTYVSDAEDTVPPLGLGEASGSDEDAREKSNQAVVAAAVAAAGRHRAHSLSFEENAKLRSPVMSPVVIHPSPPGMTGSMEDMKLPVNLFPAGLPRTNSRRRNSQTCANCNGNHITVDCPLLESALMPLPVAPAPGGSGVDTVLRKCFTTIHNNNMANSTHAFLGDEVSVRGGSNFANMKQWPSSSALQQMDRPSPFGMNVIAEDNLMANEDLAPMLGELAVPDAGGSLHSWSADSWLLSCLATELPSDVFEELRGLERGDKNWSFSTGPDSSGMALTGWVHLKVPGRKWCKRFMSLYRNNLWEYLDANESSRPVGHANLFEGSVHPHQRSTVEFVLKYNSKSSVNSARNELRVQFDSEKDAMQWREMMTRAVKLQIDDLFDLTPDSPTGTSPKNFELGKGRFSIVRRARRKGLDDPSSTRDCALKIIEKNIFWDLVARETEREDTVVREILTQSLLTVRSGPSYCPVIRLQSLFETRNHLVMELELMRDGDLHEEIATKSAVDESRASFLVASLVRAIDYCQRNGVAHRDVKLSNLALDYERSANGKEYAVIKVADFGMAAFIQKDGMLKGRCGTPGFVAPEILSAGKGEAYPSGVDMFSAGVVAYTMLCGYEPFFGVNDEELIQMNKRVDYEFEEPEWASISDEAKDMISLMMEKDAYRRVTPKEALEHPFLRDANAVLEDLFREQQPINPTRLL